MNTVLRNLGLRFSILEEKKKDDAVYLKFDKLVSNMIFVNLLNMCACECVLNCINIYSRLCIYSAIGRAQHISPFFTQMNDNKL